MYYIHISLYGLVISPPLIPPIPPVFTSCSKARGGLLEAPYILSAPFILIVVRGPRLAPLANWSRLTDPCFFLPFHAGHFGRWTASSCLSVSGKTPAWLGSPYNTWHFLLPLISLLWIPAPLISPLWFSSPWGRSPGHTMHPRFLYRSHKPLPFLMYAYQVGFALLIRRTLGTLCFLSSLSWPHGSLTVTLFYFVYYLFLLLASSRCIIRRLFCATPRLVYTTLCFQNKFTPSFYRWVFNIFY